MDQNKVTYFAETDYRNKKVPFGIKDHDRTKHVYVIGKTGMGKSTLLENMAIQDIQSGNGLTFIDPHGKSAELLLDYVPENRIDDVLYFAPFDMEYPVSFNVMEDVGIDKRHLVVNGLMSTFEKIWVDAWSARMAYILNNTLLALLEYPGSSLLGINRMLSDKDYRKIVVNNITDPSVRSFWVDEFAKYTDRYAQEATPAIQNKVGQFTSNPLIRNIIGQQKSSFDIRNLMDNRKIFIVNLSKGRVGEGNANLLGSMLITKIYLAAMSRADASQVKLNSLPNFYVYVDEFQSFANKSFADILSEARKYKLNLTLAHQYIEQMEEEVASAVFGNIGTMITFRVGAYDAEVLEKEFAPTFTAEDLVNLGIFQIYMKLMIDGVSSSPFSATTLPPIQPPGVSFKKEIIEASRKKYGKSRIEVEADIKAWHEQGRPVEKKDVKIEPKTSVGVVSTTAPKASAPLPARDSHEVVRPSIPVPTLVVQKPIPRDDVKTKPIEHQNFGVQSKPAPAVHQPFKEALAKTIAIPLTVPTETRIPSSPSVTAPKEVVSLNQLNNPDKKGTDKKQYDQNLSVLRQALSSVLEKNKGKDDGAGALPKVSGQTTKEVPKQTGSQGFGQTPKEASGMSENRQNNRQSNTNSNTSNSSTRWEQDARPKEIPEAVLKKILSGEDGHKGS